VPVIKVSASLSPTNSDPEPLVKAGIEVELPPPVSFLTLFFKASFFLALYSYKVIFG